MIVPRGTARAAPVGAAIEKLITLATELNGLEEITLRLAGLKRERAELTAALRAAELERVDLAEVRSEGCCAASGCRSGRTPSAATRSRERPGWSWGRTEPPGRGGFGA